MFTRPDLKEKKFLPKKIWNEKILCEKILGEKGFGKIKIVGNLFARVKKIF